MFSIDLAGKPLKNNFRDFYKPTQSTANHISEQEKLYHALTRASSNHDLHPGSLEVRS